METLIVAIGVHALLFVIALTLIVKSAPLDSSRKWIQFCFALLLPYLGPILTILVLWADRTKPTATSDRYIGQSIDETPEDHILADYQSRD